MYKVYADHIIYRKIKKLCLIEGFYRKCKILDFFLNLVHFKHKCARVEPVSFNNDIF